MTTYKVLPAGGGAIIKILNKEKRKWNRASIWNIEDDNNILNITIPETTSGIEVKIPIEDLIVESSNNTYIIGIEVNYNSINILTLDELILDDIPNGGDGTWHYYAQEI